MKPTTGLLPSTLNPPSLFTAFSTPVAGLMLCSAVDLSIGSLTGWHRSWLSWPEQPRSTMTWPVKGEKEEEEEEEKRRRGGGEGQGDDWSEDRSTSPRTRSAGTQEVNQGVAEKASMRKKEGDRERR